MKRFLCLILSLVFIVGICVSTPVIITSKAASAENLKFSLNDTKTAYVVSTSSNKISGELIIPGEYNGLPVTGIAEEAFNDCSSLTVVTIPDTVTNIGSYAFEGCSALTSVVLSENIELIDEYTFWRCEKLKSITIPENVKKIGSYAFANCKSLKTVKLGDALEIISTKAFCDCDALTSITIPDSVEIIEESAYESCDDLWVLKLGAGINEIGSNSFKDCATLENIVISNTVKSIGKDAFLNTAYYNVDSNWENDALYIGTCLLSVRTSVTGDYVINDGTTIISDYAFSGCSKMTSVTIPESVISFGEYVFNECSLLKRASINGGEKISRYTFNGCTSLSQVIINEGVKLIEANSFKGCTSLVGLKIADSVTSIATDVFTETSFYTDETKWENDVLYVGNHLIKARDTLSDVFTVKDGTVCIADSAFVDCVNLTKVKFPLSLLSIGNFAFSGCTAITSLDIPNGVKTIGENAFLECCAIKSVYFGTGIEKVGESAFNKCTILSAVQIKDIAKWCEIEFANDMANPLYYATNLFVDWEMVTDLEVPETVTRINSNTFYNCDTLETVKVPDSVKYIGTSAFAKCSLLESVEMADSVKELGSYVFYNCPMLKTLILSNCIESIPSYAFYNCSVLDEIRVPETVTGIGKNAFYGCEKLTSINIPESVTCIQENAFLNCDGLKAVYITSLEKWCNIEFSSGLVQNSEGNGIFTVSNPLYYADTMYLNGKSLTNIEIPDGVEYINRYAFYNCESIKSVNVPNTVKSIGEKAFYKCDSLEDVSISDGVKVIGDSAFADCSELYEIVIPDSVFYMGDYIFSECTNLNKASLGKGIICVPQYAFYKCSKLEEVGFESTLNQVERDAFNSCSSLKYVFFNGSEETWNKVSIEGTIDYTQKYLTNAKIHFNATGHSGEVQTIMPFAGVDGVTTCTCTVCGCRISETILKYVNDYVAGIGDLEVGADDTQNFLTIDTSACNDLGQVIMGMDGYTIGSAPNSDEGFYGTSSKVFVYDSNNAVVKEYTLVVKGDVNGDSVCDVLDCMLIELARHTSNNVSLEGAYLLAGDLAEDNVIDENDLNAVVNRAVS